MQSTQSQKRKSAFQSLINILSLTSARDKYARIIQYFFKFLTSYMKNNLVEPGTKAQNNITEAIAQLDRTAATLSTFRKVIRFGSVITLLQSMKKRISTLKNFSGIEKQFQVTKLVQEFGDFWYVLTDHILFFYRINIIVKQNPEAQVSLQYWNDWLWMWGNVFAICGNIIMMAIIKAKRAKLQQSKKQGAEEQKEIAATYQQIDDLVIDTTKFVSDIPLIVHCLHPSLVGPELGYLCGTFTSAIGIYQLFKKDQRSQ